MDSLLAFYKIHYNFAALGVLIAMLCVMMLLRGNTRWLLIFLVVLVAYNIGLKRTVDENPAWFETQMKKYESFDFVDYIWGSGTIKKQNTTSEKRLDQ